MPRKAFGSYMLEERLAVGGMGELFLASTSADRPLTVVKILHRDFLENEEFVAMFEDEGRIGSRLAHPNIVGVYDTGKVGDVPFIVFEFIDGENLRTVLRASAELGMPVPAELALRIVVGVLLGLDHAHRARDERGRPLNLVHRDLSPDNIVLSWDGEAKILDFGIAKADGRSTHTQVGILKGKSQYMAPEQAKLGLVDQRSDLYSAGVVLLELLTGRKRFDLDDPVQQILMAQEWTAYKPSDYAPGLPAEIDAIVLKALARAPENRFQSAEAFAVALTRILQQGVLPRSEAIASFLRRLFPGRVKRAGLGSSDEQTLHPKGGAPRTPMPTVRKPPAVPAAAPSSDEPTATRTATAPGSDFDDPLTRASASALPLDDETDERTRARAPAPPMLDDDMDTSTERAPVRNKAATAARVPFIADEDTTGNDRPTTKQAPVAVRRDADKPTAEPDIPPPIIRPPGSTPRPGGTGAFTLDFAVEEGGYELDDPDFAPPEKPELRRPAPNAALPAVKKKRSRRTGGRLLLGMAFAAAGAGALAEHRDRLERISPVASAVAFARGKLGLTTAPGTPAPDATPWVVVGTNGEIAAPHETGTPQEAPFTPEASVTPAIPSALIPE